MEKRRKKVWSPFLKREIIYFSDWIAEDPKKKHWSKKYIQNRRSRADFHRKFPQKKVAEKQCFKYFKNNSPIKIYSTHKSFLPKNNGLKRDNNLWQLLCFKKNLQVAFSFENKLRHFFLQLFSIFQSHV
jgi:hypothetical protein